jgi:hypothetical protein
VPEDVVAGCAAEAAVAFAREPGTTAVVVPPSRADEVAAAVRAAVPGAAADGAPAGQAALTEDVVVLTPAASKGLEFDSVLVVDPAGIVAEGVRGMHDLYVALTRATQRLGVVHPGELPGEVAGLARHG